MNNFPLNHGSGSVCVHTKTVRGEKTDTKKFYVSHRFDMGKTLYNTVGGAMVRIDELDMVYANELVAMEPLNKAKAERRMMRSKYGYPDRK